MVNLSAIREFCTNTTACKLKNTFSTQKMNETLAMLNKEDKDIFTLSPMALRQGLLRVRDEYIKKNPDAFITLDHIKSNYDNHFLLKSVEGQTKDLQAVSKEDFCNLSEIMKNIRLPHSVEVSRAMEANDFNIGRISPEKFFNEYYKEGKEVVIPVYMSTSLNKDVAYRFAENNPNRFIINLKVDKNVPAVYMEGLAPGDGMVYGYEDEINIIRNAKVILGKMKETINPRNNQKIYEVEGHVTGFKDTVPEPPPAFEWDDDSLELLAAIQKQMKF